MNPVPLVTGAILPSTAAPRLTDGGEDTGEAEVVHCVEGEKMVQKLFPFFLAAQKGVPLIKLSRREQGKHNNSVGHFSLSLPGEVNPSTETHWVEILIWKE